MPGQATVSKNIAPNLCHKLPKYICALTTLRSTDEWRDLTIVAFFLRRGKANRGKVLFIEKSQIKSQETMLFTNKIHHNLWILFLPQKY